MRKSLMAAAVAVSLWGGAALAEDASSTSNTYPTTNSNDTNATTTQDQSTQGIQQTRTATAWRVHYQCNGAMPAAGQMQPPPGGQPPAPQGPPPGPPPGPAPGGY